MWQQKLWKKINYLLKYILARPSSGKFIELIDATARRMGLSDEKVMINIQKVWQYNCWNHSTLFMGMGAKLKNDNIILAVFGGGFTWGQFI